MRPVGTGPTGKVARESRAFGKVGRGAGSRAVRPVEICCGRAQAVRRDPQDVAWV